MSVTPLLASTIGQIFEPLYTAMAWLVALFYALIPNYALAIALLTIAVMAVTSPLTLKSTRSMLAMQRLAPEMKKLQAKYKNDKVALNEEMTKLYREHNVNPLGGCLPLLIQMPVFFILYGVIRGLTNTVTVHGHVVAAPRYIGKNTKLYASLRAHPGQMKAFGINIADTVFTHQDHWWLYIPFAALILIAIGLQYLQMYQMNNRNPAAAQANPQMQAMQKYMPLIFAIIYLRIAAAINIYFIVSTSCRIGLQKWVFHTEAAAGPAKAAEEGVPGARERKGSATPAPRRKTFFDRLADMQAQALEAQKARESAIRGEDPPPALETGAVVGKDDGDKPSAQAKTQEPKTAPAGRQEPDADENGASASSGAGQKPGGANGRGRPPQSPRRPSASSNGGRGGTAGAKQSQNGDSTPKPSHPRAKSKRARRTR